MPTSLCAADTVPILLQLQYMQYFPPQRALNHAKFRIYCRQGRRWLYAVCLSDTENWKYCLGISVKLFGGVGCITGINCLDLGSHPDQDFWGIVYCVAKTVCLSNRRWKQRPNRCIIIGDAILPQTSKNWPKLRFWIWRFAQASSDAAEIKLQYMCTIAVPQVHNGPKSVFEILLPVWRLVRKILFVQSRFGLTIQSLTTAVSAV